MKVIVLVRAVLFLVALGLPLITHNQNQSDGHAACSAAFSAILKKCTQICSDIDLLQECNGGQDHCALLANALIGKMVNLDWSIDGLLSTYKQGKAEVRLDDLDYLITVMDFIESAYNRVTTQSEAEIVAHFMARKIKKKLENILLEDLLVS